MGCRVPWDSKSDANVETCTSSEQIKLDSNNDKETLKSIFICLIFSTSFRKYIDANNGLKALTKTELTNTTHCLPPCSYWKYTQVGEGNVRDQTKFGKFYILRCLSCQHLLFRLHVCALQQWGQCGGGDTYLWSHLLRVRIWGISWTLPGLFFLYARLLSGSLTLDSQESLKTPLDESSMYLSH